VLIQPVLIRSLRKSNVTATAEGLVSEHPGETLEIVAAAPSARTTMATVNARSNWQKMDATATVDSQRVAAAHFRHTSRARARAPGRETH